MIYFVRRKDGAIKIGFTRGIGIGRIRELEKLHGPLVVLGVHAGDRADEMMLHVKFYDCAINRNSTGFKEWFLSNENLLTYISQNTIPLDKYVSGDEPPLMAVSIPRRHGKTTVVRLRLKELMSAHGITQSDLAAATGINEATLSRYVNNKVDRLYGPTLDKFLIFFKCQVDDLLCLQ